MSTIHRLKQLQEYIVEVEIPEGLTLNGVFPFDATIYDNVGRFKVYAVSREEAVNTIKEYLQKQ